MRYEVRGRNSRSTFHAPRTTHHAWLALALVGLVGLLAGCGGGPTPTPMLPAPTAPTLHADPTTDPTTPIVAPTGRSFVIVLDANPSTGYRWELAAPLDEGVVTL